MVGTGKLRLALIGAFLGCLLGGLSAQSTPAGALRTLFSALSEQNIDKAFKACGVEEYAKAFNFEVYTKRLQALTPTAPAPQTSELYKQINMYERMAHLARQFKFFLYSFSDNEAVKTMKSGMTVVVSDNATVSDFIEQTKLSRLSSIKVTKTIILYAKKGSIAERNNQGLMAMFGASEVVDAVVLLDFAGKPYGITAQCMRYDSGWKVLTLASNILGGPTFGGAQAMSEANLASLLSGTEGLYVAVEQL